MITLKTSVLVAAALQFGAIVAGASKKEQKKIYNFGISLGLAFQLQDDYLDTFGDVATFGKKIGGDILENKKTWLYLKALESAKKDDRQMLLDLYNQESENEKQKIKEVTDFFVKYQIDLLIKQEIKNYTSLALNQLQEIDLKEKPKAILKELVLNLEKRNA
jgi:geranylgeranyl diphosphate synthase type II